MCSIVPEPFGMKDSAVEPSALNVNTHHRWPRPQVAQADHIVSGAPLADTGTYTSRVKLHNSSQVRCPGQCHTVSGAPVADVGTRTNRAKLLGRSQIR